MDNYSSYKIIPDLKLILTNYSGQTQMSDIALLTQKFMSDSLYDASYNCIMDWRDAIAIGYNVEVIDYVDYLKHVVQLPNKIKVGIVIHTPNQEFLVSMYKPLAIQMNMEVEKFKDMNDCLCWMNWNDEEIALFNKVLAEIKAPRAN